MRKIEHFHSSDILDKIQSRIRDPKFRSFSAEASFLLGEYTAEEVIREVKKLDNPSDEANAREFVSSFDSQKGIIEHIGPTGEFVRLQLLLARTEGKYNFDSARNRLIEIYLYICDLKDLAIKTECLARLAAVIDVID